MLLTHTDWRSFNDVTRINLRFRLLVTWSSAHGRDASSCKIWCRYLYPMRSYWHFPEIKDGGHCHLGFVGGEPWDHPRRHTRGAYSLLKFCHDRISSFQVIRDWNFCRSGLKVLFTPQNLSFWGILPPKFRGTSLIPPKGTSLRDFTSNELSRVKIHPVWPVRESEKKGINK